MKLTPLDIKKQEFKRVMRGYDPVEVDTFMDMVAGEMEELIRQGKEMRDKTIELDTQLKDYRQIEKTLQQTLLQAQETTGRMYDAARKETELMLKEAEAKAAQILEKATADLGRIQHDIQQLTARRDSMIGRMKVLLSSELDLLRSMEASGELAPGTDPSLGTSGEPPLRMDEIVKNLSNDRSA